MAEYENESSFRCFLYDPELGGEFWGDCCEDLGIVPKPLWLILLFTLPVEAALAGADVRATDGMYAKKKTSTAFLFIVCNGL